jgi:hydroxyacylglutathione hydrolase
VTVVELEDHIASGAMVVDVRSAGEFAEEHILGSIFVGVGPNFSTWMGWLAPYDRGVVLIANDAAQAGEALTMASRIGLDRVAGYCVGVEAWRESGRSLGTLGATDPDHVMTEQAREKEPTVIDVRNDSEFEIGHIDGAVHHFLGRMAQGEMPALPRDEEIVITCASGYRSTVAASLLLAHGYQHLRNLGGGMNAWNERKAGSRSVAS